MRIIFITLIVFILSAVVVSAAERPRAYLEVPERAVVGSEFPVTVFIDSDIALNAYSFEISYSSGVEPTTFDWRGSIIDLRQDQPRLSSELVEGARPIVVEGASLSPFSGDRGRVITLNFRLPSGFLEAGGKKIEIGFHKAEVFPADGTGMAVSAKTEGAEVLVAAPGSLEPAEDRLPAGPGDKIISGDAGTDATPPEIKEISLSEDPFNTGRKILGFLVVDDASGVEKIEARTRRFIAWSDWGLVRSPVGVPKNVWSVALRATDRSGNMSEKTLYDWSALAKALAPPLAAFVVVAAAASFFIGRRGQKPFKRIG